MDIPSTLGLNVSQVGYASYLAQLIASEWVKGVEVRAQLGPLFMPGQTARLGMPARGNLLLVSGHIAHFKSGVPEDTWNRLKALLEDRTDMAWTSSSIVRVYEIPEVDGLVQATFEMGDSENSSFAVKHPIKDIKVRCTEAAFDIRLSLSREEIQSDDILHGEHVQQHPEKTCSKHTHSYLLDPWTIELIRSEGPGLPVFEVVVSAGQILQDAVKQYNAGDKENLVRMVNALMMLVTELAHFE